MNCGIYAFKILYDDGNKQI